MWLIKFNVFFQIDFLEKIKTISKGIQIREIYPKIIYKNNYENNCMGNNFFAHFLFDLNDFLLKMRA